MRIARLTLGAMLLLAASQAQAQIVLTLGAPGVQATTAPGATTESFDSFAPGTYTSLTTAIGTYSSPSLAIVAADSFGGAGGSGSYFAVGAESGQQTATLTTNGDQGYFGFWLSAGDAANAVQLYEGSQLVYTLDTPGLLDFLNAQPNAAQYYGNPNTGADPTQPFAYVNLFGTNGTTFNKIVLGSALANAGFEADNLSVAPTATVTGTPVIPHPQAVLNSANGHYYERVDTGEYSWSDAVNAASQRTYQGMQGHLVTITSQAENDFIVNNLGGDLVREKWTGAYQTDKNHEPDGSFAWITGEAWGYTNWEASEPSNSNGNEDTFTFKGAGYPLGTWNDVSLSGYAGYLVEYEAATVTPEPGSVALLLALGATGAGFLSRLRRRRSRD